MKTILVPVELHHIVQSVLETALLLGRKFDARIEAFALSAASNVVAMDPVNSFTVVLREHDLETFEQSRGIFEGFMQDQNVPRGEGTDTRLSYGWVEQTTDGDDFVGSIGRVFDIIVLGRPGSGAAGPRMTTLEAALFETGRPVLLAPPTPPKTIGDNIMIAWNCSTEQARATAFALPLLQQAKRVTVLTVEGATVPGPTGEQIARYLQFNGVPATAITDRAQGRGGGEVILAHAAALGCDLIVKGAYTQSRLRQMIFGGTTRHILANATLPVFTAH